VTYTDQQRVCRECGKEFVFTVSEQEFHAERGFTNAPARCPECRALRRAANAGAGDGLREMHTAVCAECGQEASVPFLPHGDKPVYCAACFQSRRGRW
jgi:CxxC-x17-CxxC domain-containing protein